ncbi:MAG: hypothetical protein PHQ36_07770 [Anaerolineales bacterium]|nr:hypothetical protein [Anaerolineales bacterium]
MTTTPQYDRIIETIPTGLEKRVMDVLQYAFEASPGINVTRQDMIQNVFGVFVEKSKLSNNREDRQIREAIENLQRAGYPIISSSGKPGYRLAINNADMEAYIAELESRRSQLEEKIRALRTTRPNYFYVQPVIATQPALI